MAFPTDPAYLRALFDRNARTYEFVNRLISAGQVARWRRELVRLAGIPADGRVLDAFAGPGSLGTMALARLGPCGELVLADLSPAMVARAEAALGSTGAARSAQTGRPRVRSVVADLLDPAVDLGRFDVVLLGFGLRYVPDVPAALESLGARLSPGGRLALLEFTRPKHPAPWHLPALLYFRRLLPALGAALAGEAELYDYLCVSARDFLTPAELGQALWRAGLVPERSRLYLGGLVSVVVAAALPPVAGGEATSPSER